MEVPKYKDDDDSTIENWFERAIWTIDMGGDHNLPKNVKVFKILTALSPELQKRAHSELKRKNKLSNDLSLIEL